MPSLPRPRARPPAHHGATITECVAALAALVVVVAVTLPALGRAGTLSGVDVSLHNLATIGAAHALYALDSNGRQWTNIADDISAYGDDPVTAFTNFTATQGDCGQPCWHPPLVLGWGLSSATGNLVFFRYFQLPGQLDNHTLLQPISFGPSNARLGSFRYVNARPLHDYLGGRFYDPVFYAPNDDIVTDAAAPGFAMPWEYADIAPTVANVGDIPFLSSYALSPAAMYHPDVFRAPPAGGWQDPWTLDHSFASPGLFQATYPALKTHAIEHEWLQNAPDDRCNPAGPPTSLPCSPYPFNAALASTPATLFYDLSTRLLPNAEAVAADEQVATRSGFGLWSRDTPFGVQGYYGKDSVDGVNTSHHVLTTSGILGRDTLWTADPLGAAAPQGR